MMREEFYLYKHTKVKSEHTISCVTELRSIYFYKAAQMFSSVLTFGEHYDIIFTTNVPQRRICNGCTIQ